MTVAGGGNREGLSGEKGSWSQSRSRSIYDPSRIPQRRARGEIRAPALGRGPEGRAGRSGAASLWACLWEPSHRSHSPSPEQLQPPPAAPGAPLLPTPRPLPGFITASWSRGSGNLRRPLLHESQAFARGKERMRAATHGA